MARINLLPWREERRKLRQNEFYAILGGAVLTGVLAVVAILWSYGSRIDAQNRRNEYLKQEIAALDAKIKEIETLETTRQKLLSRKKVIEDLQSSRSQMVHLFDDLVRTIPEGVRLVAIKQNGEELTLDGLAESNARVSTYMRNLETSEWVTTPELAIVEAKGPDRRSRYAFTLKVALKKQKTDEEAPDPNAPPAPAVAAAGGSR